MVIFSFFSGVGMLDLGFQEAGFDIVFVNEYKQEFLNSYQYARRNRYPIPPRFGYYEGDINQFLSGTGEQTLQRFITTLRQQNEQIGFIGGPPCPDFSVGGKNRGRDGDNGKLAQSYVDMINKFQPDFFLFENVKGLIKTQRHREYFEDLKLQLQNNRYYLSERLLNALSFGVPQDRDRILLMGVMDNSIMSRRVIVVNKSFDFPWLNNRQYDVDAVKSMNWPVKERFVKYSQREFPQNVQRELTIKHWFDQNDVNHHPNQRDVFKVKGGLQRIQTIEEGDTSRKSYKRLHRWRYSPTAAYGNNEVHLHPNKIRRISVAEAMAIQSLPAWFELPADVSLTAKFKMVGNGVPFLMAKVIADKIGIFFNISL